jgi:hypothetical protein
MDEPRYKKGDKVEIVTVAPPKRGIVKSVHFAYGTWLYEVRYEHSSHFGTYGTGLLRLRTALDLLIEGVFDA